MHLKVTARGPEALARTTLSIRSSIEDESGRCPMRNHDLVSDGFLALTAGGLVLLCSSLVALAFG